MKLTPAEWRLSVLMTMVQLVGTLSFMVVMPLGPDFTRDLGMPAAQVGWVLAAYTLSSAVSGITAALFIDRFDRRPVLALSLVGLVVANLASAAAWDMDSLLAARVLAGVFGGPAAALSIAIVADNVPLERRGQAMGMVMGAISISAVIGVPLGLEIAHRLDWRYAFLAVAALGLSIIIIAIAILPPQRSHMEDLSGSGTNPVLRLVRILTRRATLVALALSAVSIVPGFMVITNMAVYVQFNLGFPREDLGLLYMAGGLVSFFGMRWTGRLVDRFGSTPAIIVTTLGMAAALWLTYVDWARWSLPLLLLVPALMVFNTARIVAQNTAVSKVPDPSERAGFMALVQTCTQVFGAGGALLATSLLATAPDGSLLHMPTVAIVAILVGLPAPLLMWRLEGMIPRSAAESHRVKAAATRAAAPPG
ncbi:MAG: hypothetical protein RLY86_2780 [Pseudomonadota bacterium]